MIVPWLMIVTIIADDKIVNCVEKLLVILLTKV